MKKFYGKPSNCNSGIIGRVTTKPLSPSYRSDSVFITDDLNRNVNGYTAVLTADDYQDFIPKRLGNIPIFHSVEGIEEFNDGDIILMEPSGTISMLYEKNSLHNALMVTERCNCNCLMCPQPRVKEEENKTEINLKLISLMDKATKYLGITGGEPTLMGDDLFKIISACKKYLPETALELLTNGIQFENFEYAKKLACLEHPNLTIGIPLYADTDLEHDHIIQTKGFYKTIQGIYNLALFKQKIEIRTVIHRLTYERLPKWAEFIYHNFPFVIHIALMGMETIGLARKNIDRLWIDPYDYISQLEKTVEYLDQRLMNVSIYNLQLCILPRDLWPFARKSISSWKNIYLEECQQCDFHDECGGFFSSSKDKYSKYIHPLRRN